MYGSRGDPARSWLQAPAFGRGGEEPFLTTLGPPIQTAALELGMCKEKTKGRMVYNICPAFRGSLQGCFFTVLICFSVSFRCMFLTDVWSKVIITMFLKAFEGPFNGLMNRAKTDYQ